MWVALNGACAVRAAFDVLINVDVPAAAADLDAAFRSSSDVDLSAFLHTRGINMRYLPQVAACCRNPAARQYLEQEAVIRTAKHKIRALWAERAESDAHAAAIAADVIQRLRRGDRDLWSQLLPADGGAPSWAWEPRLRAAIGLKDDGTLTLKIKNVRPPPFVSLDRQEGALLKDLEFRRATGADVLPVQFQLIALYLIWAAGDDPRDSFAKGEAVLKQVLERHRRGPSVENAIATAARWYYDRGQFEEALPFYEELLEEQRVRLGPDHHAVAATLNNLGNLHKVGAPRRRLAAGVGWGLMK